MFSSLLGISSTILAANISVPATAAVATLSFIPDNSAPSPPDLLDNVRRSLSTSTAFLDVILPSVQLGHRPVLYVFSIVPADLLDTTLAAMGALRFDGLVAPDPASHFRFEKIYEQPQNIISHFLGAVRTRLIDNIVASNTGVQRCKDGFLISHHQQTAGTDWGTGWEYKALSRPLVFCHIQLQPTTSIILIRPTLLPTPYLPLHSSLPLLPRSPILLLPHATPAYFLTTYSGPTSALARQFTESLQGHGQPPLDSSFIIGWISVENRQGEDKGITFIYPTRLCLAFVPALNRPLLDYTPDLPGPLQPSPKLYSATTPLSECPPAYPHRPSLLGSPSAELQAFRMLTLSKSKNIHTIAAQVSSYVDHVAKDRERERERLKREREGGSAHSPSLLPRTTPSMPAATIPPAPAMVPPLSVHTPTPSQITIPSQNFYPSPPQADATVAPIPGNTSPVLPVASQPRVTPTPPTAPIASHPPPLTSSSSSSSYDPFGYLGMSGVDMSMDFGMDMGMNFGMSMEMNLSGNSNSNSGSTAGRSGYNDDSARRMGLGGSSGMDFEDFTDDDFNFFDQPSTQAPVPPPLQQPPASAVTPISNSQQVTSPPLLGGIHLSGPGPPHPTPHSHPTPASHGPWSSNFPEGFTPRSVEHMDSTIPPDLVPPSSDSTPSDGADRGPLTPNVHLEHDAQPHMPHTVVDEPRKIFGPIPFAKYHRVADGKYGPAGKFGLPSPPPDEPEIPPPATTFTRSQSPLARRLLFGRGENVSSANWRTQYNAITDPRVGVMRKLIGVKRRHSTQGGRTGKDVRKSLWTTEHEEWKVYRPSATTDGKEFDCEPSEDEVSQSEDDFSEEEEEEETPATSRPSTPPPSYLPLGPTLLHTQFHHTHLLPLSKPLRPPGSSISGPGVQGGIAATPMPVANVPTPVSPAAGLGLTAEKWKALEVVVNVLAKEAVENVVWRDTWTAGNTFGSLGKRTCTEGKKLTEVWVSDVRFVARILGNLEGVQGGLSIAGVFGQGSVTMTPMPQGPNSESQTLQVMNTPKISVGKGDTIINILPPALRFWEKLGLGPKGGDKDGTVYVLFADDGEQHRQGEVAGWLSGVCNAYETKHLGKLRPGTGAYCVKDGLVPLRFDLSFRKLFATFAMSLSSVPTPVLLFLVVPITFMSLCSPIFRQILSSMQKALRSLPENRVVVQLIPEHTINYMENDPANANQLEAFCVNLYNRILVPVDRPLARAFSPDFLPAPIKAYLQKPLFTLARPAYNKVAYTRSVHTSLDVLDRYTLLHVGYRISACGKWVMAACVDQRGEAWDQAVWLLRNDHLDPDSEASVGGISSTPISVGGGGHEEAFVVRKVWEVVVGFARKADVEWRIVISKLGTMEQAELTAWSSFLPAVLPTSGLGSVHVSLICADPDSNWMFTKLDTSSPPQQSSSSKSSSNKHVVFSDISSTTYALFPSVTLPVAVPPTHSDLGLSLPYVADPSSVASGLCDGDPESVATSPASTTITASTATAIPISPSLPTTASLYGSMPHPIGLLPQSTTCLIRVPCSSPLTSISTLHIHLLSTHCHPPWLVKKSATLDPGTVHADVTKNFYELSVLAQSRWKMAAPSTGTTGHGSWNVGGDSRAGVNPILPLHLAMVEIMSRVTDGADSVEIDS
ncbi:hypothetical protein P691DRAFT_761374 [Macrolepiota fuliginosa MF-IS2]|uniref:Mediator of RNA polymerase II transcription subunit 13 n=1 Tax=Macrolepiota fuliginosa MF-IS2 TaxID=1400762 RepID=A0A9P5XCD5_9AGAR|nr:hypothetical protein P691DRAFT_761374 [Macrolepiota fuliginosa MF-IS2]